MVYQGTTYGESTAAWKKQADSKILPTYTVNHSQAYVPFTGTAKLLCNPAHSPDFINNLFGNEEFYISFRNRSWRTRFINSKVRIERKKDRLPYFQLGFPDVQISFKISRQRNHFFCVT